MTYRYFENDILMFLVTVDRKYIFFTNLKFNSFLELL